jgi:hypothetical protein
MPAVIKAKGKSMFIKEALNDNPKASARELSEAWQASGQPGTISASLVSQVRSRMGLAGKRRRRRRKGANASAAGRGRQPMPAGTPTNGAIPAKARGKKNDLMNLEIEIDRLLMKVVEIGWLGAVEDDLRKARRHLYAGLAARS